MSRPTKAALICDIKADLKDIACDNAKVAKVLCDLAQNHNPCQIKVDLKTLDCLAKDLAHDWCDVAKDIHTLECCYHYTYTV